MITSSFVRLKALIYIDIPRLPNVTDVTGKDVSPSGLRGKAK